jgi:hypothetical protein
MVITQLPWAILALAAPRLVRLLSSSTLLHHPFGNAALSSLSNVCLMTPLTLVNMQALAVTPGSIEQIGTTLVSAMMVCSFPRLHYGIHHV